MLARSLGNSLKSSILPGEYVIVTSWWTGACCRGDA